MAIALEPAQSTKLQIDISMFLIQNSQCYCNKLYIVTKIWNRKQLDHLTTRQFSTSVTTYGRMHIHLNRYELEWFNIEFSLKYISNHSKLHGLK
jgi:hypothetical protein